MSTLQRPHEKTQGTYAFSKLAHRYLDGLQGIQIDPASAGFKLASADGSQDFIVAPYIVRNYAESLDALQEWYRVVKDGGYLVLTIPHSGSEGSKEAERDKFTNGLQALGWRLIEVQDPDDLDGSGFTVVIKVQKHDAADPTVGQVADLEFFMDYSVARNLIPRPALERMLGRMVVALDRLQVNSDTAPTIIVKSTPSLDTLTVPAPEPGPLDWNKDGVVILKNFMPEALMRAYEDCWIRAHGAVADGKIHMHNPAGWTYCTPYRDHPELLEILSYGPLHDEMRRLIGEPAAVHLNLTGWVTSERNFHQDSYLSPPHVGDYYVAVWIALENIHPDSGPFQYVPGSHRWRQVTREKTLAALEPHERTERWPFFSERFLTPLFEEEIVRQGIPAVSYLPKRGDVLLWHSRLLHRGSKANVPGMLRKALIAHYSGIHHRQDMPPALPYGGGYYFPIDGEPYA
jgi:hypothetical protein